MLRGRQHFGALDGLRGLAALAVVFSHCAGVYLDTVGPAGLSRLGLKALVGFGHPSVVLFYVLSGFVLFVALERRSDPLGTYMIKRVFRIWPALLAALLVAVALHGAVPLRSGFGGWTTAEWTYTVDPIMFLRNALLFGVTESDRALDPVSWSLALEVRFSLLLYPLFFVLRRNRWAFVALSVASYLAGAVWLKALGMSEPYQAGLTPPGAVAVTLFYLPGFCLGMLAGHAVLHSRLQDIPAWFQVGGVVLAGLGGRFIHFDVLAALCDALAILLVAYPGPMQRGLTHRVTAWLGRVSYSLYLIHFPLLMAVTFGLAPRIGLVPALAIVPPLSLLLAELMYRFVESPGMAVGKALASRRLVVEAAT